MRVQTKLILSTFPILFGGFLVLSVLSFNTAKGVMREDAHRYIDAVLEARTDHTLERRAALLTRTKMDKVKSFVELYKKEALDDLSVGSDGHFGCFAVYDGKGESIFTSTECGSSELLSWFRKSALEAVAAEGRQSQDRLEGKEPRILGARYFEPWDWVLVYSIEPSRIEQAAGRVWAMTFGVASLCFMACALAIMVVFRRVFGTPIMRLKTAAARIASQEPNVSIEVSSRDELGDLSASLNEMAMAVAEHTRSQDLLKADLERSNAAMATEISQRGRTQTELKEAHDKLTATLKAVPDLLFEVDKEGRIYDYHAADPEDLFVSPESFLGKSVREVMPAAAATVILSAIAEAAEHGWHRGGIYSLEVKAATRWFELSIAAKGEPENVERRFVATARDITERMLAGELLRKSEESLKRATDSGNVGLWAWDLRSGQLYYSPVWKRQIGYDEHELHGTYQEWESRLHPADHDETITALAASHQPPWPPYRVEFRLRHKDGSYRHIFAAGALEFDAQGQPLRMHGSHIDITDLKRAEEEKVRLEAQLSQAQKMESIGRLAGGVAHDFNNMLGVILGQAELALLDPGLAAGLRESLNEIQDAAKRSADLTQQLLAFARKQTIAPKVLDLNDSVSGTLKLLKRLIGENITLEWQPGTTLSRVRMDPSQISQILANLCVNARDAIADVGKITIKTSNVSCDDEYCANITGALTGEYIQLAISDTGHGMDEQTQARMFEPFFTTKSVGEGSGLGLATVYGIVKQNHGFITVQSEVGLGTTIRIHLPRYLSPAEQSDKGTPESLRGSERILLVEDEVTLLKLTTRVLERLGYTVLPANTAEEALRLAAEHNGDFQLLMTDVVMPGMNGKDLCDKLTTRYPGLKCLFVSGYPANVIANHGVLEKDVSFIQKPLSMQSLGAKLREVLDKS